MITASKFDVAQPLHWRLITNMEALKKFRRCHVILPLKLLCSLNKHSNIFKKANLAKVDLYQHSSWFILYSFAREPLKVELWDILGLHEIVHPLFSFLWVKRFPSKSTVSCLPEPHHTSVWEVHQWFTILLPLNALYDFSVFVRCNYHV